MLTDRLYLQMLIILLVHPYVIAWLFVHCKNDKCVFMQITYFLKINIFSSIQHL